MPGRQYRDDGDLARVGRKGSEKLGQLVGVVVDGVDVEVAEQVCEDLFCNLTVLEHVRDPRRHAQVVLEHVHGAVRVTDEVAAADVGPHSPLRSDPLALGEVVHRRRQDLVREDAIGNDLGVAVEVVDEKVERGQPLDEAVRYLRPLLGRDHAWDHVEGPGLVDVGRFAVHREGDAHRPDSEIGRRLPPSQLIAEQTQVTHHPVAGITRPPVDQQLVPAPWAFVPVPPHRPLVSCSDGGTTARHDVRDYGAPLPRRRPGMLLSDEFPA